ncbi:MAG: flagellar protein FliS [Lachnospiraceae bacterium]|nr:flagellar protein FliS [Lachnospiraceae bacterium]
MENSLKQDFTRRLSLCNKGEMIVIMYEIVFAYLDEAKQAHQEQNHNAYKLALRHADVSIESLIKGLDFSYEISKNLHSLYVFCRRCVAKAIYQNKTEGIEEAEKVLRRLYSSFLEAAKSDNSRPLMGNIQNVYAGITYGKTSLNENYDYNVQRGFLV